MSMQIRATCVQWQASQWQSLWQQDHPPTHTNATHNPVLT
jgi:hypothetical protein